MRTLPIPEGRLLIVQGERLINHIRFAIFHTSENTLALALNNQNGHGFSAIDLPPGSWSKLGKASELTEEQMKLVCDTVGGWSKVLYHNYTAKCSDYRDIVDAAYYCICDSYVSFLTFHGIKPEDYLLIENKK